MARSRSRRGGILSGTVELLGDDGTDVDYQGDSSRTGSGAARTGGNGAAGHDAVK